MREQLQEIINILERGENLPCGFDRCTVGGKIVSMCHDEITDRGRTCMLKQRNLAIQKLKNLINNVSNIPKQL